MLDRLSETITNAGIPLMRIDGTPSEPVLVFQEQATQQQRDNAAAILASFNWSDATHASWLNTKVRKAAAEVADGPDVDGKTLRALVGVLVDELNIIRNWLSSFKVEVAAASNLTDLKTRVANLPNMPDRTVIQARTAVINKLSTGAAD